MNASCTCKFDLQQDSVITYQCQSGGKGQRFDKGSGPVVGTFDHRQVPGQGLLNFL